MASRYCVNTGNWNSTSTWSATSGGASGASVPTSADEVVINSNKTVTLTANAAAATVNHTNGTLNLSSYKLSVDTNFISSGSTTRAVYCALGGVIEFTGVGIPQLSLTGTNLTFDSLSHTIIFNRSGTLGNSLTHLTAFGYTFKMVIIRLTGVSSTRFNIGGSGMSTASLLVSSDGAAAHTLTMTDNYGISSDKYVLVSPNPSNRLIVRPLSDDGSATMALAKRTAITNSPATFYGQNIELRYTSGASWATGRPGYAGSGSILTSSLGWVLQDPPKASTLIDPLTTSPGSNSNWAVGGTVTQVYTGYNGGGYKIASASTLTSVYSYDLVDSFIVFQRVGTTLGSPISYMNTGSITFYMDGMTGYERMSLYPYSKFTQSDFALFDITVSINKFIKVSLESSTRKLTGSISDDGVTWVEKGSLTLPTDEDLLYFRSIQIGHISGGDYTVGSFNPQIAQHNGNFLTFFNGA